LNVLCCLMRSTTLLTGNCKQRNQPTTCLTSGKESYSKIPTFYGT
jgi:hypothetical protein